MPLRTLHEVTPGLLPWDFRAAGSGHATLGALERWLCVCMCACLHVCACVRVRCTRLSGVGPLARFVAALLQTRGMCTRDAGLWYALQKNSWH